MTAEYVATAQALAGADKGLLGTDESNPTCNRRFATAGIPQTVEARRAYRELILTTPGAGECISGAILYDETIRQRDRHSAWVHRLTGAGIVPGIKVGLGAKEPHAMSGQCFGVEDAPAGVEAARAGRMAALGVARLYDRADSQAAHVDMVVTSLDEVHLDALTGGRLCRTPV